MPDGAVLLLEAPERRDRPGRADPDPAAGDADRLRGRARDGDRPRARTGCLRTRARARLRLDDPPRRLGPRRPVQGRPDHARQEPGHVRADRPRDRDVRRARRLVDAPRLDDAERRDDAGLARPPRCCFTPRAAARVLTDLITLEPGDVVTTGSPAGVGTFRDPPVYLKPGDTVTVSVDRIGDLTNPVEAGW